MVGWMGRWFLNLVIAWIRKAQAEPIKVYNKTSWSRALPLVRFTSIANTIEQVSKVFPICLASVSTVYLIILRYTPNHVRIFCACTLPLVLELG